MFYLDLYQRWNDQTSKLSLLHRNKPNINIIAILNFKVLYNISILIYDSMGHNLMQLFNIKITLSNVT